MTKYGGPTVRIEAGETTVAEARETLALEANQANLANAETSGIIRVNKSAISVANQIAGRRGIPRKSDDKRLISLSNAPDIPTPYILTTKAF